MTCDGRVLACAMLQEANWSRSSSCWDMSRFKRPSDTLAASSGFGRRSMLASESHQIPAALGCSGRVADHPPGTMLPDATGNYRLAPTSKNYALNRPPRAGVCSPFRIAHIENKGRLPRGVTQDFAKQASPQRRLFQRLFMVDHFR